MNFAYSWAFFNPVRKVYYNLAITGLSVAICFFIGTIEVLGLLPTNIGGLHGGFWSFMANLSHQQGRVRDCRHVHPDLGRRPRVLADRPRRGEVERTASRRARARRVRARAGSSPRARAWSGTPESRRTDQQEKNHVNG